MFQTCKNKDGEESEVNILVQPRERDSANETE